MSLRTRGAIGLWAFVLALFTLGAFSFITACVSASRVREGQLYRSGTARYDAYFAQVHDLQVAASLWTNEKAKARKVLLDELSLPLDASDGTITESTHDKLSSAISTLGATKLDVQGDRARMLTGNGGRGDGSTAALITAIERAVRAELQRQAKLKEVPKKTEELARLGDELESSVKGDFAPAGNDKVGEVRNELKGSLDALALIRRNANRATYDSNKFLGNLQKATMIGDGADSLRSDERMAAPPPAPREPREQPATDRPSDSSEPVPAEPSETPAAEPAPAAASSPSPAAAAPAVTAKPEPPKPRARPRPAPPPPPRRPAPAPAPAPKPAPKPPSGEVFNP